ncbi:hypothetical protein EON65_26375 [archaeon]|nr:MAG: hypothetical protein EON65_26375 [archaeon]
MGLTEETRSRIQEIQKQHRNCVAIVVGLISEMTWTNFQNQVEPGPCRLLRATDLDDVIRKIQLTLETLNYPEKYAAQSKYFAAMADSITSSDTARDVCRQLLQAVDIPDADMNIIMEAFPTIAAMLTAPRETMEETLPVDSEVIEKLMVLQARRT